MDPGGWGDPTPQPGTSRRSLRQGDSGEDVRYLQQKLVEGGAWLTVDGKFGPATANAVRGFQSAHGLTVDGVVGPATWEALDGGGSGGGSGGTGGWEEPGGGSGGWEEPGGNSGGGGGNSGGWGETGGGSGGGNTGGWGDTGGGSGGGNSGGGNSGGWNGGWEDPSGGQGGGGGGQGGGSGTAPQTRPTIRRGSTGKHVKYLQQRLSELGYWLSVDGQFGPGTESQVRSFQRSNGLSADGGVGPATWSALG